MCNVFVHVFATCSCTSSFSSPVRTSVFTGVALFARGAAKFSNAQTSSIPSLYIATIGVGVRVRGCVGAWVHACVDGGMQRGRQRARARYDESKKDQCS
jgi:hypothetical protein